MFSFSRLAACLKSCRKGPRQNAIFASHFKLISPVQTSPPKYFAFSETQISRILTRSRAHKRGVSRSSRTLGMGCDGRSALKRHIALTNNVSADGEVVWSRRSDAGVKLAEHPLMTVATKHGHRGDHV
jgi:hypothetical protein